MSPILLIALVLLGGVGLYVALPGGRFNVGRLSLLVLAAAGGVLVAGVLSAASGESQLPWFLAFSLVSLFGALRVITHQRPVFSALYFVLLICATCGLLVLMQATFLAAAVLAIYAGAILVTYVFVIMLAQQGQIATYDRNAREPFFGCLAGFVLLAALGTKIFLDAPAEMVAVEDVAAGAGTVTNVGTSLLTKYVIGLELAAILLLAAMVGAIAIARRKALNEPEGELE